MSNETWELEKEFSFEASHQLPNHDGKCARLHGHSWKGRVIVSARTLYQSGPKQGMVMDYADISIPVKALVEVSLDHYHLNESTGLVNPTSEELARWIYDSLDGYIPGLVAVVIEETCTSRCTYRRSSDLSRITDEARIAYSEAQEQETHFSPTDIVREIKVGSPAGKELLDLFGSTPNLGEVIASLDAEKV